GGGISTDLRITGLDPASGITLDGNGNTGVAGNGDRAVVYRASENNLVDVGNPTNIFGVAFGVGGGILMPGFGAGRANDTISVDDGTVTTTNNFFGTLTTIHLDTSTFV